MSFSHGDDVLKQAHTSLRMYTEMHLNIVLPTDKEIVQ